MARRSRRTFTPELKVKVVLDVLTGAASRAEACRKRQISPSLLALWKATPLERLPVASRADERRSAEAARVAEPGRLVGRQALELAALKKPRRGRVGPRPTEAGRDPPGRGVPGPAALPPVPPPPGRAVPHAGGRRRRGGAAPGRRAGGRRLADLRLPAGDGDAPPGRVGGQRQAGPAGHAGAGAGRGAAAAAGADHRQRPPVPPPPRSRGRPGRDPAGPGVGGRHHLRPGAGRVRALGRADWRVHPSRPGPGAGPGARPAADPGSPGKGAAAGPARGPPLRPGGAVRRHRLGRAAHGGRGGDQHGRRRGAGGERLRRAADAGRQGGGGGADGVPGLRRRPAATRPAPGRRQQPQAGPFGPRAPHPAEFEQQWLADRGGRSVLQ
jgi:translation initiation factor IF-2